jgi:hypothetical protein
MVPGKVASITSHMGRKIATKTASVTPLAARRPEKFRLNNLKVSPIQPNIDPMLTLCTDMSFPLVSADPIPLGQRGNHCTSAIGYHLPLCPTKARP